MTGRPNWSRGGCISCKKRKKKCDETKPQCQNCQRLGLTCEGYQSIWDRPTAHIKGRSCKARRRHQSNPSYGSPRPTLREEEARHEATSENEDIDDSLPVPCEIFSPGVIDSDHDSHQSPTSEVQTPTAPSIEELPPDDTWSISRLSSTFPSPGPSSKSLYFLQYHLDRLCPILVMLDAPTNPLRSVLPSAALSSPMILNAVCAVSACHMSQNRSTSLFGIDVAAINYYVQALFELKTTLSAYETPSHKPSDETLLTMVFLCKYEIMKGSTAAWRQHLTVVEHLLKSYPEIDGTDRHIHGFVRSFVAYHSSIAKITNLEETVTEHETESPKLLGPIISNQSCLSDLDPYMGFTEYLLGLFARMSVLPQKALQYTFRWKGLQEEIKKLKDLISSWTCSLNAYIVPEGVSIQHLRNLELVATTYQYASSIYLYSILEQLSASDQEHASYDMGLPYTKQEAISGCLATIEQIPGGDGCEGALVLPLFIAGCETDSASQCSKIMQRFRALEKNVGIGNIKRARQVVQKVWCSTVEVGGKRSWQSVVRELGWDLILT